MFPSESVIANTFAAQHPLKRSQAKPSTTPEAPASLRREPFPAWSAIDDAKHKADALKHEAMREYELASQKAQAKAGKIEPWTAKYYAACTFGGMLACVRIFFYLF